MEVQTEKSNVMGSMKKMGVNDSLMLPITRYAAVGSAIYILSVSAGHLGKTFSRKKMGKEVRVTRTS